MNIPSMFDKRNEKDDEPKLINWPAQSPYIYTYVIIGACVRFYIKGDYTNDLRFRFTSATFLEKIALIKALDVHQKNKNPEIFRFRPCDIMAVGKVRFNRSIEEYSAISGDQIYYMIDSEGKTDDE